MVSGHQYNWIILRGLARGRGHWGSFEEKLETRFPQHRFYFLDIPGNGLLHKWKTPFSVQRFIPALEYQLEQMRFDKSKPTYALGLSLGAMTLVEWATQKPDLFKKIVLINTSASNFSPIFDRLRPQVLKFILKYIVARNLKRKEILTLLATTSLAEEQIQNFYQVELLKITQFSYENPTSFLNLIRQLWAASRYEFPEKAPISTLILSGKNDNFVSPACSLAIEKAWHCDHLIHASAGHDIGFEDPQWLMDRIEHVTPSC